MTKLEAVIYNRISSKCNAYVRYYFPDVYRKLAAAAEAEYNSRQSRRNNLQDLQKILSDTPKNNIEIPADSMGSGEFPG